MFKHILIPTDGSKLAKEAAEAAVRLAAKLGARVTGFFAAPPSTPIMFKGLLPAGYASPEEHEKNIAKVAQAYLGAIEKAAKAAGVRCAAKPRRRFRIRRSRCWSTASRAENVARSHQGRPLQSAFRQDNA